MVIPDQPIVPHTGVLEDNVNLTNITCHTRHYTKPCTCFQAIHYTCTNHISTTLIIDK